jgi:hypothetical protein
MKAAWIHDVADSGPMVGDWRGEELVFHLGDRQLPARLVTCRPEDRAIGAAQWVEFAIENDARKVLADPRIPVWFATACPSYQHQSPPLSEEIRQSLLDDLQLSDRDGL